MTSSDPISLKDALGERYLAYAMSTITARSLPDVRDGLKPVHRRLLYAMRQLKLDPESGFKKCARVVGDVIGKYHPHGDTAVYDAMVRLAQSFAVRYPLVEGQGNFGSIDGDNAAAMRYTEARLTEVAMALLEGIDQDAVDFRPTYDGGDEEPVILPAAFPNLLANGSEGIAVGMATSIPPHNIVELCDALLLLLRKKSATTEELVECVQGPDFPTGGVLVEPRASIIKSYETGRGSFRIRARWEEEDLGKGQYQIVVTEIPYQVQKSRLIEKIAELFKAKKLPLLGDIRDESAEDIRIVLEPKSRNVPAETLMESLFRLTDLETRFNMNLNVLTAEKTPKVLSLKDTLRAFLDHRHEVLLRRSRWRLEKIIARLHMLDGFLIAYLNLDEVIRIIREEDEPKQVMMAHFGLSDTQVEAILNMRLRSLRKLEEIEIRREHDSLSAEKAGLEALLEDEGMRWKAISGEIKELKKQFGPETELGRRRTGFAEAPQAEIVSIEAFIEKEPLTILLSKMGWIRALKGHQADLSATRYKEGDEEQFVLHGQTTDKLLLLASNGRIYTLDASRIPTGRGFGEPVRLMIDLEQSDAIRAFFPFTPGLRHLIASEGGKGFLIRSEEMVAQTRSGKQILNLKGEDKALLCHPAEGDHVAVIGTNRKLLIYPIAEMTEMKRGAGLTLQKYKSAQLVDLKVFMLEEGLSWQLGERTRTETDLTPWLGHRGQVGRLPPNGFPRSNRFSE